MEKTVKVRVKRALYYFDLQPDGTFTKIPVVQPAGKIITMRVREAAESVSGGKAEYVRDAPVAPTKEPGAPSDKRRATSG